MQASLSIIFVRIQAHGTLPFRNLWSLTRIARSTQRYKPVDAGLNIYQLSGLDDRERGFTRQVECSYSEQMYQVVMRYERLRAEAASQLDEATALQELVNVLQEKGYTQLRSQLIFQGEAYLGSQEQWVDYADPMCCGGPRLTAIQRIRQWLNKIKQLRRRDKALRQC